MKHVLILMPVFLCWGCSQEAPAREPKSMMLVLNKPGYAELVDFCYDFAGDHRLEISWYGWYRVDHAVRWYERSEERSKFMVHLGLSITKGGSINVMPYFDEPKAGIVIRYGDGNPAWIELTEKFEEALTIGDWRVEWSEQG